MKIPVAFVLLERTTRWHYFTAECAFTSEISHGITRSHQFISWPWGLKANQFAVSGNNAICSFRCTKQIRLLFSVFHNTKNNACFCVVQKHAHNHKFVVFRLKNEAISRNTLHATGGVQRVKSTVRVQFVRHGHLRETRRPNRFLCGHTE